MLNYLQTVDSAYCSQQCCDGFNINSGSSTASMETGNLEYVRFVALVLIDDEFVNV